MIADDLLNFVLSKHLCPEDVLHLSESNPILFKTCVLSFLQQWMIAPSFWEFGKMYHKACRKPVHPFLAYDVYNSKAQHFNLKQKKKVLRPTLEAFRHEWNQIYQKAKWTPKETQVWNNWYQHTANQYPSEKRQTCHSCRLCVPQEEMYSELVCSYCQGQSVIIQNESQCHGGTPVLACAS